MNNVIGVTNPIIWVAETGTSEVWTGQEKGGEKKAVEMLKVDMKYKAFLKAKDRRGEEKIKVSRS